MALRTAPANFLAMSTPAQTLANQQNAQRSTGPTTPEGKAAASRNAATHGLHNADFTLLPHEDAAAFQSAQRALRGRAVSPRPR